jgi:hypothetical protein
MNFLTIIQYRRALVLPCWSHSSCVLINYVKVLLLLKKLRRYHIGRPGFFRLRVDKCKFVLTSKNGSLYEILYRVQKFSLLKGHILPIDTVCLAI